MYLKLQGLEMNAPNRDVTCTNEKSRGRKCMEGKCPQHPGVHLFLTRIECTVADMWCTCTRAKEPERHLSRDGSPAQLNSSGTTTNRQYNGDLAEDRKMTSTGGDAKSEAGDRVRCGCYFVLLILSFLFSLFCALSNKILISRDGLKSRSTDERYKWPPEVLIMLSKEGTWFIHREMYYRAARIAPERRASLVHYHTNEEVRDVMKVLYVQETDDYDGLKSALFEAFGVRTGSERFSAVFFRRKQQRGESMRDYAGHLRWLFPKAFSGLSGAAGKETLCLLWALREFRPYFYNQRFLVRTDRSCLRWLRNFKEPEGHVARCLENLAELDFEVEHRARRLHGNADALSHASCTQCGRLVEGSACALFHAPEYVTEIFGEQLLSAQRADPEIHLLRQWLCGANWPLVRKSPWRASDIGTCEKPILLPQYERRREGMVPHIHSMCDEAITAGYPLHRVSVDILGPLERTLSGNRYVLVLTDYFTKWTAAFPLTNMEAGTVAKVLVEKYIAYFGAPDYVHIYQGRSFKASVMMEMYRLFDIRKTRYSPYNPQGNGQAERFNQTLLYMLSNMVDGNPHQWDNMLPFVILAYYESTRVTPAIAMFSRWTRAAAAVGRADWEPAGARKPRATLIHPENPGAHRPCARAQPPRVVDRAKKTEARPRLGGALTDSGDNGAPNVPGTTPRVKVLLTGGGTTRQQEHQPPAAASPPASEMKVRRLTRRRRPPGYLRDYTP
ncbi:Gypsy retrotransposon integrase-like protein 1 [Trichinella sp. T9]|nr:Gypsy retrotransposon integrase-like protein 1 [Trichinella sp. T9]